ncbi:HpcH/HpaI aldolase family protein [Halobaculum sp. P14]|uniref:HpcH/HpaI aldolase family protein n=1 Tax=Halobaculum sp. P14 TaxID=3421638 RepID=UPI003EB76F1A
MTDDSGIRAALREGRPAGAWLSVPSPQVAEQVALTGVDFVVVDTEHAPTDTETVESMIRAVDAAGGVAPLVRVAEDDLVRVKYALDAGARGIVVPNVDTAAEAESVVDMTRFPPEGSRGVAGTRASAYGRDLDDYVATANDRVAAVLQVESGRAVDNAAAISRVDGVDTLFVGPADLSASLGVFGEYESDRFVAAVEQVLAESEVPVGTLATAPDEVDYWEELGFDYQIVATDADALARGVAASLDRY